MTTDLQGHTVHLTYSMSIFMIARRRLRPRTDGFGTTDACRFVLLAKLRNIPIREALTST